MEGRLSSGSMETLDNKKIQFGFDVRLWGSEKWFSSEWYDEESRRDAQVKKARKHGTIRDDEIRLTTRSIEVEK